MTLSRKNTTLLLGAFALSGTLALGGCANSMNNTQKGAGIGAVVGAIAGKATGDNDKSRYVWGAALGALAGGAIGAYMDKQEKELKEELADSGVDVYREGDTLRLVMPGNITYATSSAQIQNNFYPVLNDVALVLNKYEKTKLKVAGHTDSTGDADYNVNLSQMRANSVADYLANNGVSSERLMTVGYGETQPIASNETATSRQQNRRVELQIIPLT